MPPSSSRRVRRSVAVLLAILTLALVAASRYVVPTGLGDPDTIPLLDDRYTAQISGFVDVPPAREIALAAFTPARLVVDGLVVAEVEAPGLDAAAPGVPAGVHRVLVHFVPVPSEDPPRLYLRAPDGTFDVVPAPALSPRRLPPAAWRLRRHLTAITISLAAGWTVLGASLLLGWARRWFAAHLPATTALRRAAWGVMALTLVVFAFPFWWGVPVSWSLDEVWPADHRELIATLTPGWNSRYPPLHIFVVALANSPLVAAGALDLLDTRSALVFSLMKGMTHLVSVAMAVGAGAVVFVCASRLAGARAGVFAALFWTLTLPAVFYAKTANLDIPYTFWFAVALLMYVRALDESSIEAHVGFAASATLAVVTKDQAYALFVLPALHLAAARAARLGSAMAFVRDRVMLLPIVVAGAIFAVAHNLPLNWSGFVAHVEMITGDASEAYRMVDSASPAGQLWLLWRSMQQLAWSHTWPGAALAGLGILLALRNRSDRSRLAPLLVPAVSYYVGFIMVVGYTYDRFMLPISVVLVIFAGFAVDRIWRPGASKGRLAAASALLVLLALRTVSLNLLMAADGRYDVQRWIRANIPPETRIGVVESPEQLPSLWNYAPRYLQYPVDQFSASSPPVVVVSDNYRRRFVEGDPEVLWHDTLLAGRAGYRIVLRHRARVPLAIIQWERQFTDPDPSFSSLHKVNPEITVLVRNDWTP
jgi:hypothetical protein